MGVLYHLSGTIREFDGYDRWEREIFHKYGTRNELEQYKVELDKRTRRQPDKSYENIQISEATEEERKEYIINLEKENEKHKTNIDKAKKLILLAEAQIRKNEKKQGRYGQNSKVATVESISIELDWGFTEEDELF